MLNSRILNPQVLSLLARVRHTNALVIADRGFPSWRDLETIDLSLIDDLPTVLQVLGAVRPEFNAVEAYMAREFLEQNSAEVRGRFEAAFRGVRMEYEPHVKFKERVPRAIGLIRTGDTIQYSNVILVSG
jgi:D-ribose pyranase